VGDFVGFANDENRFWKLPRDLAERTDLSAADKLVFIAIVDRIGGNCVAWPGQRTLARDCGLNVKVVNRAVSRLSGLGLLDIERPANLLGPRSTRTCRYRLRSQTGNVPKATTFPKRQRSRSRKGDVPILGTKPDQVKKTQKGKRRATADLERIYGAYPRKVGRKAALGEIERALRVVGRRGGSLTP